jgi:hypothetical protein
VTAARLAALAGVMVLAGCAGGGGLTLSGSAGPTTEASTTAPGDTAPTTVPPTNVPPTTVPSATGPSATTLSTTTLSTTTLSTTTLSTTTLSTSTLAHAPATGADPDRLMVDRQPAALAEALAHAERQVRDPGVGDEHAAGWGRLQQRLYATIAGDSDLAAAVLARLPADLRPAAEANLAARRALSSLATATPPATELPAWRIRAPLPLGELLDYYRGAEEATGVGWEWLAAIHLVETRMGRIEGTSTAGAIGPMQFLPSTWAECCEGDPLVDRDAIHGAARYLRQSGAPADMAAAVFRYNPSERYVRAITAYAGVLAADPAAYRGYWSWEVYFRTHVGLVRLPPGYDHAKPVPVEAYLAEHPDALVPGS